MAPKPAPKKAPPKASTKPAAAKKAAGAAVPVKAQPDWERIEMASRDIGPEALVSAKLLKLEIGAAKAMLERGPVCFARR